LPLQAGIFGLQGNLLEGGLLGGQENLLGFLGGAQQANPLDLMFGQPAQEQEVDQMALFMAVYRSTLATEMLSAQGTSRYAQYWKQAKAKGQEAKKYFSETGFDYLKGSGAKTAAQAAVAFTRDYFMVHDADNSGTISQVELRNIYLQLDHTPADALDMAKKNMKTIDTDKDGSISKAEHTAFITKQDANGDGRFFLGKSR
jgi:hypothetical protein